MLRSNIYRAMNNLLVYDTKYHHASSSDINVSRNGSHSQQLPYFKDGLYPIVPHQTVTTVSNTDNTDTNDDTTTAASTQLTTEVSQHDIDIVFIHGLRGHPFGTWRIGMDTDITDSANEVWPDLWLYPDLLQQNLKPRLFTVGYEAELLTWSNPWPSLSLKERAKMLLKDLQAAQIGLKDGPPVIFITHSMGGLLLKELLLLSSEIEASSGDGRDSSSSHSNSHDSHKKPAVSLTKQTKGIVFLAVPHIGANIGPRVNAKTVRSLIQAHPATKDLASNASHLLHLHGHFRGLQIPTLSLGEELPALLGAGIKAMIVLPESANPQTGKFHIVQGTDHMNICKPEHPEDPRYTFIKEFILQLIQ